MLFLNTTLNISDDIHEVGLKWLQDEFIPKVIELGQFSTARMFQVRVEEEMGGVTYAIQYQVASEDILQKYYTKSALVQKWLHQKFPNKIVSFQTELDLIKEY